MCTIRIYKQPLHTDFRYTASATEAWELSSLAHKVNNIHEHLKKQLALCKQHIGWPLTFKFSIFLKNMFTFSSEKPGCI